MPSSSDQTRVGRNTDFGRGAESSWRAETSNSRLAERHPYFALLFSARTARIDDISGGGPMVRIHFPPAVSPVRT